MLRITKPIQKINHRLVLAVSLALFFILPLLVFAANPAKVSALSGSDFNAGRIIDDAVFYNGGAMSASQIQQFLNSKVPTCDTNGTQAYNGTTRAAYGASRGYPAPYTCLKSYTESIAGVTNGGSDLCTGSIGGGTKSSAQIIYDVARACGVSPQVLIVLLQKEQSLVTDDWPWSIQYRSATGYGCPDTAPCDSEYYGFFNQVYQAAKAYKRYRANSTNYNYRAGRNNTILWNPNTGCGTSNVYIENQATAGLYIYTPYRPNQAALNNLYGTGDSCSSYGNRNFWRMFNDWFGSTHTDGYAAQFVSFSGYVSGKAGEQKELWIRYRNTGPGTWRDSAGSESYGSPTVLAVTNPINKSSPYYDNSWPSTSRVASNFYKVYEANGTTLAADQHVATQNQIVEYRFTIKIPYSSYSTDSLWVQPVREGASNWNMGAIGFFNITSEYPTTRVKLETTNTTVNATNGSTRSISLRFKNTGTENLYDHRYAGGSIYPTVMATTNPINRTDPFRASTWYSINRPTIDTGNIAQSNSGQSVDPYIIKKDQTFTMTFDVKTPYGTTPGTYNQAFQLVKEGDPSWNIPESTFTLALNVTGKEQALQYHSMTGYPSISPNQSANVKIRYRNTGTKPLYDGSSYQNTGYKPLVFATTLPINRSSHFYDPSWSSKNRPATNFSKVFEEDGVTPANNQHIAQPGQVLEFSFNFRSPSYAQPSIYREWIIPVLEGSANWDIGGLGYFDITVP